MGLGSLHKKVKSKVKSVVAPKPGQIPKPGFPGGNNKPNTPQMGTGDGKIGFAGGGGNIGAQRNGTMRAAKPNPVSTNPRGPVPMAEGGKVKKKASKAK